MYTHWPIDLGMIWDTIQLDLRPFIRYVQAPLNEDDSHRANASTPPSLRSKTTFEVADVNRSELAADAYDVAILSHSLCCIEGG